MSFKRRYIPEPTVKRRQKTADEINAEVAEILMADPALSADPNSLIGTCARKWRGQAGEPPDDLPLFRGCE